MLRRSLLRYDFGRMKFACRLHFQDCRKFRSRRCRLNPRKFPARLNFPPVFHPHFQRAGFVAAQPPRRRRKYKPRSQIWQKFQMLINLNKIALQNDFNAKFIFLKIDEASLISRLKMRTKEQNIKADTIEKRGISYLLKVQKNIENVIEILGLNALKIDANLDKNEILNQIKEFIK